MAKRVRIFFINCPSLAIDAASFLILAQNQVQSTIQFEVIHFWIYGNAAKEPLKGIRNRVLSYRADRHHKWFPWLERRYRTQLDLRAAPEFAKEFDRKTWRANCQSAIQAYDNWFDKCGYTKYDTRNDPAIIITETPLKGRYISDGGTDIAVLSAAYWKDFFSPASALEFVLTSVQRLSLRLSFGSVIGSHYPTRGCLGDFHCHQPDARISAFLGYLCETCREGLKKVMTPNEFDEVMTLLKNNWLGKESDTSSVAGVLKKNYKYPLSRSTGLSPGVIGPVLDSIKAEAGKKLVEIVKWVIILLATFFFLTYLPDVTEKLQSVFASNKLTKIEPTNSNSASPTPDMLVPIDQSSNSSPSTSSPASSPER